MEDDLAQVSPANPPAADGEVSDAELDQLLDGKEVIHDTSSLNRAPQSGHVCDDMNTGMHCLGWV